MFPLLGDPINYCDILVIACVQYDVTFLMIMQLGDPVFSCDFRMLKHSLDHWSIKSCSNPRGGGFQIASGRGHVIIHVSYALKAVCAVELLILEVPAIPIKHITC